jgi:hypothetical protein
MMLSGWNFLINKYHEHDESQTRITAIVVIDRTCCR